MYIYFVISLFVIWYIAFLDYAMILKSKTAWLRLCGVLVCLLYDVYVLFLLIRLLVAGLFGYIFFCCVFETFMVISLCHSCVFLCLLYGVYLLCARFWSPKNCMCSHVKFVGSFVRYYFFFYICKYYTNIKIKLINIKLTTIYLEVEKSHSIFSKTVVLVTVMYIQSTSTTIHIYENVWPNPNGYW